MNDPVLNGFLDEQYAAGMALADRSDLLELEPVGPKPVQLYVAHFTAKGLVRRGGEVVEADRFDVGIHFGRNYLRWANPAEVLTLFAPADVWHPNLRLPFVCPGWLRAGTGIVDLLHQVFDIWTFKLVTPNEFDSLNPAACSWARMNRHRFPIDPRPLCRRSLQ
jgi:hypothetical protein